MPGSDSSNEDDGPDTDTETQATSSSSEGDGVGDDAESEGVFWEIIGIVIVYGLLATLAWFLLPPPFNLVAVALLVMATLWTSFDVLEETMPRVGEVGKRLVWGGFYGTAGLVGGGILVMFLQVAGTIDPDQYRVIVGGVGVLAFVFGFAIGDDPFTENMYTD